jgi:hypothetical protein
MDGAFTLIACTVHNAGIASRAFPVKPERQLSEV